ADLSAEHATRTRLVEALLLVGAFGLVLAGLTGVWLARRAVAPLAGALALQRRFVADAGHELRTPLTLLSTRAQLIQRSLRRHPQTPVDSDVDGLVADSRRLAAIVDDLLLSADGTVPRESVDLGALARAAADSIQPQAEQRHVRVVIAGETPATVLGASVRLRRAVDALLDNAVRHARSEVRLTVGRLGGHAVVAVSDDGPGIDPEIRPRLFDRFATTPADRGQGGNRRYGLGLALVSEIAAQHSGSVEVVAGQETTFRLRLPAV
ncbi:MAG: HAMP domain-containing sensor histidine kinase, partial [Kibdelosporangium sp.]